jgi:hypothetical protein
MLERTRARLTIKIESKGNSSPHSHFTEYLVDVSKNHHESMTRVRKTQAFDPAAQEHDRLLPANFFTESETTELTYGKTG